MTTQGTDRAVLTAAERRALLDEFFVVCGRLEKADLEGRNDPEAVERHAQLRRTYREKLPVVPLSRCPFTKAVYTHSFDPHGIDGLWWDYRAPNRPLELLGGNVVAFTGAMRLGTPLESMPFLCKPGPGVPFIVPRILRREGVHAVISSHKVGCHTGYAIVYFANPAPDDLEGFNDWGTDDYQFEYDTEHIGWSRNYNVVGDYDFALEPWLVSGKLLWIAPGDEKLTLREGVAGCPYIGLEGPRQPQLVQDGEVWYEELLDDEDTSEVPPSGAQPTAGSEVPAPEAQVAVPGDSTPQPEPVSAPDMPRLKFCGKCGAKLRETAVFCTKCGTRIGG